MRLAWIITLLLVVVSVSRCTDSANDETRGQHLILHRHTAGQTERLQDGDLVSEGDTLEIAYASQSKGYGLIFSVDGRDSVMVHRSHVGWGFKLLPGPPDTLSYLYEIDDAPTFERFYFVTADAPFGVSPFVSQAKATGRIDVPESYNLHTTTLRKP